MNIDWPLLSNFFIGLIAIVNPLGKIPLWIKAQEGVGKVSGRWLTAMVVFAGGVVLLAFLIGGNYILQFFGIDIPSFRIGGGVVIMVVGIQMLQGNAVQVHGGEESDDSHPVREARTRFKEVVVPMAVPLLAGPGSITTSLLYGLRATSWVDHVGMSIVLLLILIVVYLILRSGPHMKKVVGTLPFIVITRIFGLIVVAVAAQLMIEGLGEAFPNWVSTGNRGQMGNNYHTFREHIGELSYGAQKRELAYILLSNDRRNR